MAIDADTTRITEKARESFRRAFEAVMNERHPERRWRVRGDEVTDDDNDDQASAPRRATEHLP